MTAVHRQCPTDARELRHRVYSGDIFLLPSNSASNRIAREARQLLSEELRIEVIREAHTILDDDTFFERIGRIRKTIFLDPKWHRAVSNLVSEMGLDPDEFAIDPMRLRVVAPGAHHNPRAQSVYYAHRDTWYAHPQSVIAWWIPLDDLDEKETFVFYPQRFRTSVPNDSEIFAYEAWVKDGWDLKIGWQDQNAGRTANYPNPVGQIDFGSPMGFSCRGAENLLFAGAHFHQTLKRETGQTRYSLDFRIVHLPDHEKGMGAPNVDNRSQGSALVDYVRLKGLR